MYYDYVKKKKTNDKIIHNLKRGADPFLEKFKKYFMCRTLFTYITLITLLL